MPLDVKENVVADLEAILDIMPQPSEARIVLRGDSFDYSSLLVQAGEIIEGLPPTDMVYFTMMLKNPSKDLLLKLYRRQLGVHPSPAGITTRLSPTINTRRYIFLNKVEWYETNFSSQDYNIVWKPNNVRVEHGNNPPEFILRLEEKIGRIEGYSKRFIDPFQT